MKNPIIKNLFELLVGWLIYCLILMFISVTWDLLYTKEFEAIPRIFPLFGTILYTFIKYTFAGFIIYSIFFMVFTYTNVIKESGFRAIFNIIIFHLLMIGSFIITLYIFHKIDPVNTAVEMQFIFGVATILMAVVPYFKSKIIDPVRSGRHDGQQK